LAKAAEHNISVDNATLFGMEKPGFRESLAYVGVGFRLMRTPGLRRFLWMPLAINLLVFGLMGWWIYAWATTWLASWALFSSFGDWWIVQAFATLLRWLFTAVLLFSMAFFFTLLANLIAAPFNGLLAERVEAYLVGDARQPAPSWVTLVKSLPRLMGSELAKIFYLIACLVPLFILQFIPLINIVAPALLFLFGAWMFTLEYMDYPMGNHGALFRDVRRQMRQHRGAAYGFGCTVAFLSSIPIINLFIMPAAVAGATALYVDHIRDEHLRITHKHLTDQTLEHR